MHTASEVLQSLYDLSLKIYNCLKKIDSNMENNDLVDIDMLLELVEKREALIKEYSSILQNNINWGSVEQEKLAQMREWELAMQTKLNEIFQAFSIQLNRLQQGKQTTKFYNESSEISYTEGVYLDKRN